MIAFKLRFVVQSVSSISDEAGYLLDEFAGRPSIETAKKKHLGDVNFPPIQTRSKGKEAVGIARYSVITD